MADFSLYEMESIGPPNGRHNSHSFPMVALCHGGLLKHLPPLSQFVCNGRADPVVAQAWTSGVTSPVLILDEETVFQNP